jgi:hypothetical protein
MKYIAGESYNSISGVSVALDDKGLPSFIPLDIRAAIKAGNVDVIKIVISLLTVYRVINYPGMVKLNTITDPLKEGSIDELPLQEIQSALLLLKQGGMKTINRPLHAKLIFSNKSGPNTRPAFAG